MNVRVINARFMKPLDAKMLDELAAEGLPLVVIEEGAVMGGLGSAVLEHYALTGTDDVLRSLMGVPDVFVEHGSIGSSDRKSD